MFTRRNTFLLAVFVALLAANFLLGRDPLADREGGPLFPELRARDVARVELADPAAGPRDTTGRVELLRSNDGWTVTEAFGFPAQGWAVDQLIHAVEALQTAELVGEEAESHERFGVGDSGVRVRLRNPEGRLLAEFVHGLGASPEEQNLPRAARRAFVRPAGEVRVYRAPLLKAVETDPSRWLRTPLFEVDADLAREIRATWTDRDGERRSIDLLKRDDGRWRHLSSAESRNAEDDLVRKLLASASGLISTRVVRVGIDDEDGLGPEAELLLEITEAGGEPEALRIGPETADGDTRRATLPGTAKAWVVEVPAASVELMLADLRAIGRVLGDEATRVGESDL